MPKGPEAYRRLKQLLPVYGHKLNDVWQDVRLQIRDLLDKQQVRFSTIDVVRFRTNTDQGPVISPVVIWVGVLPDSLLGEDAFKSANGLLALLESHGISDVDIEYRESVFRRSAGPKLYEPASNLDAPRHVIDPLTTALGLPIAAAKTPHFQGTMGFYFTVGDDLFGVTARHVLFPTDEDNNDYARTNTSMPRKDVLLMGTKAWDDYLQNFQIHIGNLGTAAEIHEDQIARLEKAKGEGEGGAAEKAGRDLTKTRGLLDDVRAEIDELQALFEQTRGGWSKPADRVIGHVVWSPAITVGTAPQGFTKDVAIVKLDKDKFGTNFKGNVIDLGAEIDPAKFVNKMYPRTNARPGFKWPAERLLELRDIVPEELLRHPDMVDHDGEKCLYVIKRGLATLTTIGREIGLFSYAREYFSNQTHRDSVEVAILSYDNDSGPFSKVGDSGSIVVDGLGRFVALLTGGSGKTESSDITYGSPMFWLWLVIKAEYPHANLSPVIK